MVTFRETDFVPNKERRSESPVLNLLRQVAIGDTMSERHLAGATGVSRTSVNRWNL